jgi:GDPmannose 4,6-dehydratase
MPTALITGVNGQDGSYLVELLSAKGYRILGTVSDRNALQPLPLQIRGIVEIVDFNLMNQRSMEGVLRDYKPEEIYNLAARASSRELWEGPVLTGDLNALAVARMLDAISHSDHPVRFLQASSSEVFGDAAETPQSETTPLLPRNPYGAAKAYAQWMTAVYRQHRGLFACSCILYNHESPRRGLEFVSRKISHAAAMISLGKMKELRLGRLDARRDWGFAGDYVRAMWLVLQQPLPGDYIVATGETHSVRDFCELAFAHVGLNYKEFVIEDATHRRAAEIGSSVGNPMKANRTLNWKPSLTFQELVRMMVDADLKSIQESGGWEAPSTLPIGTVRAGESSD